jgi:curli biogenesis system outer membrane secretion channel CsgG
MQKTNNIRIGVSDFTDGTGSYEPTSPNARIVSQRPDMMMIVALSKGGAQLVNRNTVAVSEWELGKALERKLGDGRPAKMGEETVDFRPIKAGMLLGSTHFVTGSITELNWNIDAGVLEGGAYSASMGARTYRISIAIDIMVTDTITTQIVHARSYKKQIVGIETNANFFRFFTQTAVAASIAAGTAAANAASKAAELFNANLTNKKNEPIHGALRWLIEIAAYDILRALNDRGAHCDTLLPPGTLDDEEDILPSATGKLPKTGLAPSYWHSQEIDNDMTRTIPLSKSRSGGDNTYRDAKSYSGRPNSVVQSNPKGTGNWQVNTQASDRPDNRTSGSDRWQMIVTPTSDLGNAGASTQKRTNASTPRIDWQPTLRRENQATP